MKHQSTRILFEYWNKQRGTRAAPARPDIDPTAIRHALGDVFILAADFAGELRFRLAGTRLCALFDRELKGETFTGLWHAECRPSIDDVLAIAADEAAGTVAGVTARTVDGDAADMELLLLPLVPTGHNRSRAIGVLAPSAPPWWLGAKPVAELTLGTLRHTGAGTDIGMAPRLTAAAIGSRVRHGFVVYSGGQETTSGERTG